MPELDIAGIPVILIIIGLNEYIQSLGVPGKYGVPVAIGLGISAGLTIQTMQVYPDLQPWVTAIVTGAVVGMTATGLYKVASKFRPPSDP